MFDLKMMTPEAINELIKNAEKELKDRATAEVEEKKTKVVIAIRELVAACKNAGIFRLGDIYWECSACNESNYFDILGEDILEEVANILEGKY